jgi:hypothetical protein
MTGKALIATFWVNSNGDGPRVYELDGSLVPEPTSTIALIGLCGMGLIGLVTRHRPGSRTAVRRNLYTMQSPSLAKKPAPTATMRIQASPS